MQMVSAGYENCKMQQKKIKLRLVAEEVGERYSQVPAQEGLVFSYCQYVLHKDVTFILYPMLRQIRIKKEYSNRGSMKALYYHLKRMCVQEESRYKTSVQMIFEVILLLGGPSFVNFVSMNMHFL